MLFLPDDDPRREVWEACESPIEQYLCCGLFAMLGCKAVHGAYDLSRRAELSAIAGDEPAAFLFSQHKIGRYRADFLVVLVDPIKRLSRHFVIECDGHAFHSSDEQRDRDADRDGAIVDAGYKFVVRCSGRRIYRDFDGEMQDIAVWLCAFGMQPKSPSDLRWFAHLIGAAQPNHEQRDRRTAALAEAARGEFEEELARINRDECP